MLKKIMALICLSLIANISFGQAFENIDGFSIPRHTSILPNTAYCSLGTDTRPTPYCVDSTPCKTMDGRRICLNNARQEDGAFKADVTCWAYNNDYACVQYEDTCTTLASQPNCKLIKEYCNEDENGVEMRSTSSRIPGGCLSKTKEYECTTESGRTETRVVSCDTTGTMNGLDWSTTSPSAEGDFFSAALGAEFVKQIADGARGDGITGLFEGTPMGCRRGWLGLRSCCDVGGVAASNADFAKSAGITLAFAGVKAGAQYAASVGSAYVYDFIGTSAAGTSNAASTVAGSGAAGFGAFGFGTSASSAAGLFATNGSSIALSQNLYFNPYAFGVAVGIQVVLALMACNDEEAKLSQARGTGICERVGTYCRKKIFGACVERKDTFCCYNGKLALGLQTAAKLQLGLGWGSPRDPMCGGGLPPNKHSLTIEQLASLDFEHPSMQAAMEPFKEEIMKNFNTNAKPYIDSGGFANDTEEQSTERSKALCRQRQKTVPSTIC